MYSKPFLTIAGICLSLVFGACGGTELSPKSNDNQLSGGKADEHAAFVVKTDKSGYMKGESVIVEIKNNSAKSIFLPGCNQYAVEELVDGRWVPGGWVQKYCFWEGIAVEVKANDAYKASDKALNEGTFRISATFGVDCKSDRPLSSAECKETITMTSNSFKVKDCPMIALPNPDTFCPGGRIVPGYDADHICITGYGCQSCPRIAYPDPDAFCPNGTIKPKKDEWGCIVGFKCVANTQCYVGGCSGQLCTGMPGMISTCEWMPWYACYKLSTCGNFGENGACGWEQTPDFVKCMQSNGVADI